MIRVFSLLQFLSDKSEKSGLCPKTLSGGESGRDTDVCDAKAQKKPNRKERKKDKGKNKNQRGKMLPSVLNLARKSI